MDARFINPFIKSICNTLETMCELKVGVGKPKLHTDEQSCCDVSAIIGFSGDAAGSVVLRFDFETAAKTATSFAKFEITPDHEDFGDALGELANMVAGGAKAQFEGLAVDISLPNVVIGKEHHFPMSKSTPRLVIPCSTSAGAFEMMVGMVVTEDRTGQGKVATAGASA